MCICCFLHECEFSLRRPSPTWGCWARGNDYYGKFSLNARYGAHKESLYFARSLIHSVSDYRMAVSKKKERTSEAISRNSIKVLSHHSFRPEENHVEPQATRHWGWSARWVFQSGADEDVFSRLGYDAVKLAIHVYELPTLRMSGDIPLVPPLVSMLWTRKTSCRQFRQSVLSSLDFISWSMNLQKEMWPRVTDDWVDRLYHIQKLEIKSLPQDRISSTKFSGFFLSILRQMPGHTTSQKATTGFLPRYKVSGIEPVAELTTTKLTESFCWVRAFTRVHIFISRQFFSCT